MNVLIPNVTGVGARESLFLANIEGLLFEHHFGTSSALSRYNWADGTTTATDVGTPTYGTGFMDISGSGSPKGMDTGKFTNADGSTWLALVDPNTAVGYLSSTGTNTTLKAVSRLRFDVAGTPGDTITLNGQVITLVASGASGFQANIGANAAATAQNVKTLVNANGATFLCSVPLGNAADSMLEFEALTAGAAGNSIATTELGSTCAWDGSTFSGGSDGDTVTHGLYHSGTNFQFRNSALGTGGLAQIAVPGAANYHFIAGWGRSQDLPRLQLGSGGALGAIAVGTTAGRSRATSGNINVALSGAGTGTAKIAFAAVVNRVMTDAERLETYLKVKGRYEALGLTVN